MHLDRAFFSTLEGRHLVLAYALVFVLQGGYLGWMVYTWNKLGKPTS